MVRVQDDELVGGSESEFTVKLEGSLEVLNELHQEVLAEYQAGKPATRIMQLLNDSWQLPNGKFITHTPHKWVPTTSAERQAGWLAKELQGFVKNSGVEPISETQKFYLKILAGREFMRGLVLFHRLFGAIADPLEDAPAWNKGERRTQLLWLINLDVSIFHLMTAGESEFKNFLEQEGIDCPFQTTLELFLDALKCDTQKHIAEVMSPQRIDKPIANSKKQRVSLQNVARNEERKFRKFLNHTELSQQTESEYIHQLRAGTWWELALLALRPYRYSPKLEMHWKNYLNARLQAETLFISTKEFWDGNGELWRKGERKQKSRIQIQWNNEGQLFSKQV